MRDDDPTPRGLFEPVDIDRVADAVVGQIEDLIVTGALRPGQKLPPERELAEAMAVSRPKLREAMHRLEDSGLLEIRRSDGAFVRDLAGPVLSEPMVALCARHLGAFLDFLEYRREQEAFAARLAAERATERDHDRLREAMEAMEDAAACSGSRAEADRAGFDIAFHEAIVEAAHNAMLLHVMRSIYELMARGIFQRRDILYQSPETRAQLLAQHRDIVTAILERRPEEAAAASDRHLDFVAEAFHDADLRADRSRVARKRGAALRLPAIRRR